MKKILFSKPLYSFEALSLFQFSEEGKLIRLAAC
jgi:hypothetical protein